MVESAAARLPALAALAGRAAGVLAVPLSRARHNWIVWLRPEYARTVVWGASAAPVTVERDGQLRLAPRESYELWRESVSGSSRPWDDDDVDAAIQLRAALGSHVIDRAEELGRLTLRLSQLNEELEAFAYAAAHDLKEPLRGIHIYASFLAEDYGESLDEAGRRRLTAILSLSTQMGSMINSLLEYARSAQEELDLAPLDIPQLVARAADLVAARLEDAGGSIVLEDPGPPGALRGDASRIVDVLANLFANALKYRSADAPLIRVGVRPLSQTKRGPALSPPASTTARETLALYVTDNGIGIAPENHEEIFRVFRRLQRDTSALKLLGSTGAGLAVCRRIVQRHGGVMWVESAAGEGATFYVELPQ